MKLLHIKTPVKQVAKLSPEGVDVLVNNAALGTVESYGILIVYAYNNRFK